MVFAALHAPQWPAPIPLFVLALGLGIVYERTGSLLAPICMHAVFNGFSTLMLFHVALQGPDHPEARSPPGPGARRARRRSPSAATNDRAEATSDQNVKFAPDFSRRRAFRTDRFLDVV